MSHKQLIAQGLCDTLLKGYSPLLPLRVYSLTPSCIDDCDLLEYFYSFVVKLHIPYLENCKICVIFLINHFITKAIHRKIKTLKYNKASYS